MRPIELEALVRRRAAQAEHALKGEIERILAIAEPAARMRAYADLRRTMDDGEALPAESEERVVRSLQTEAALAKVEGMAMATTWEADRRRLAVLHALQTMAPIGIGVLAVLPFIVSGWRGGLSFGDAFAAFLTPGAPLIGVAAAAAGAGILTRATGRANSLEGLSGLLVAALAAGVGGLAVARGLVF